MKTIYENLLKLFSSLSHTQIVDNTRKSFQTLHSQCKKIDCSTLIYHFASMNSILVRGHFYNKYSRKYT